MACALYRCIDGNWRCRDDMGWHTRCSWCDGKYCGTCRISGLTELKAAVKPHEIICPPRDITRGFVMRRDQVPTRTPPYSCSPYTATINRTLRSAPRNGRPDRRGGAPTDTAFGCKRARPDR